MYAVRIFVITATLAGSIALFFTLGAFWQRVDGTMAAKACVGLYLYMSAAAFVAMMVWTCVLSIGQTLGGALIVDMVVIVFAAIAAMMSYAWLKAIEAAPKTSSGPITSGPAISGPKGATKTGVSTPVSYPSSTPSGARPMSSPKASGTGGPAGHPGNNKWGSWEEIYDAENAAYYFFNHSNGESLWEPPAGWPHAARS